MSTVTGFSARVREAPRRTTAFYALTVVLLALVAVLFGPALQMFVRPWLPGFEVPTHEIHMIMMATIFGILILSIGIQLYRPARQTGASIAMLAILALLLAVLAVMPGDGGPPLPMFVAFLALALLVAYLRPGREGSLNQLRSADIDRVFGVVALAGAIAFVVLGGLELSKQFTLVDDHTPTGHYGLMAIGLLSAAIFSGMAVLKPAGWRFLAYAAGAVAVLYGLASVGFPGAEQGSSLGLVGGALLLLFGIVLVATAEYRDRIAK